MTRREVEALQEAPPLQIVLETLAANPVLGMR
jgi:hypothetical protein